MGKIRTILFGMTGLGNSAAEVLIEKREIDLVAIFTGKRQVNPFPYYTCDHLNELALKKDVPVYEGMRLKEVHTIKIISSISPALIVVSSFDQILTKEIVTIPELGVINVHPSLLPTYRGATPTVWALLNGEEETGVTIHFIEDEKIDSGRIILQSKLKIKPDDTDGTLRFRLAELSKETLSKAINIIIAGKKSTFITQAEEKATYFPKRTIKDSEIDVDRSFKEIVLRIRAMTPYPGARLNYNNTTFLVNSAELLNSRESVSSTDENCLDLDTRDGKVRFFTGGVI